MMYNHLGDYNLDPPEDEVTPEEWSEEEVMAWVDDLEADGFDVEPHLGCVSVLAVDEYIPAWVKNGAVVTTEGPLTRCSWPGASIEIIGLRRRTQNREGGS